MSAELTSKPTLDGVKSVSLELVESPPRRNPWRPTVLTVRKFVRICHLVEQGFAIMRACEAESIGYARFRQRVSGNKRLEARLKKATDTRLARRHEECLATVLEAGRHNWLACAWWPERNFVHLYALRNVHRPEERDQQLEEPLPSAILERHKQLMLSMLREDQQRESSG